MGRYLLDLPKILRGAGLTVVEVPGWQTRGYEARFTTPDGGLLDVTGGLVHHTGTPSKIKGSDYPTLPLILRGRIDVPGPLSQLGLGRSGVWYVCAAGRANHSGAVDDWRYANPRCIGVEAEHPGGSEPWPVQQYMSYVTGCAALSKAYGIRWRGHKEAAVPYGRKPDPTFDLTLFRKQVAAGSVNVRIPQEVDDMFDDDDRRRLHLILHAIDQIELPALTRIDQRTAAILKATGNAPNVDVDEQEIARLILTQLTPEAIAAAIPDGMAASVVDRLEIRVRKQQEA